MGAGASLPTSSSPGDGRGAEHRSKHSSSNNNAMPDHALREALRHLQLSPETIDESVAALHEYARNPTEHPVDEDLAKLCTSEYTRGALHALASFLAALESPGAEAIEQPPSCCVPAGSGGGPKYLKSASHINVPPTVGTSTGYRVVAEGGEENNDPTNRETLLPAINVQVPNGGGAGKLTTMWDRLRRTRSMPSRDRAATPANKIFDGVSNRPNVAAHPKQNKKYEEKEVILTAAERNDETAEEGDSSRLTVKVKGSPIGGRPSFISGLGLRSPRNVQVSDVSPQRRALVRTGHWKLGHEIGKGSFGAVHIGLNEDSGDLIAVKVLSLQNADAAEPLYREIELMRQLTHPNIVCYLGAEVNDGEKTISIFQEWVPGSVTTLLVNFGPFSDRRIAGYTKQILQGLLYLHKERVIHRDIKGGNILIDDRGVVKLCDFGASKMLDTESITGMGDHTRVGSPLFMAPEILLREEYGPQVDIWALGGAVLEMATGHPPWQTLNLRTPVALINWVKRTEGPPPLPATLSPLLTSFLLRCFERDPNKRATAEQLLSDPFVAKHQEELPPKVSSPASDEDSAVSDIDNLSRSAAIERIRRASLPDAIVSRPRSRSNSNSANVADASAVAVPAPANTGSSGTAARACGRRRGGSGITVPMGDAPPETGIEGNSGVSTLPLDSSTARGAPRLTLLADDQQHPHGVGSSGGISGNEGLLPVSVSSPRGISRVGEDSGKLSRVLSLQHSSSSGRESIVPALQVSPAGPEMASAASSNNAPRMSTPTTRRASGGGSRAGSSSPNPFGGRRRSIESVSPRNSAGRAPSIAAPAASSGSPARPTDQDHETAGSSIGDVRRDSEIERAGERRGRGRERGRDHAEKNRDNVDNTQAAAAARGEAGKMDTACGCDSDGTRDPSSDGLQGDNSRSNNVDSVGQTAISGGATTRSSECSPPRATSEAVAADADGAIAGKESARLKRRKSGRGERPSISPRGGHGVFKTAASVVTAASALDKLKLQQ